MPRDLKKFARKNRVDVTSRIAGSDGPYNDWEFKVEKRSPGRGKKTATFKMKFGPGWRPASDESVLAHLQQDAFDASRDLEGLLRTGGRARQPGDQGNVQREKENICQVEASPRQQGVQRVPRRVMAVSRTRRAYNDSKKKRIFFYSHPYHQFERPLQVEKAAKPHDWNWNQLNIHYRPDLQQLLRDEARNYD